MNNRSLLLVGCLLFCFGCRHHQQATPEQTTGDRNATLRTVHLSQSVLAEIDLQIQPVTRKALSPIIILPAVLRSDPDHEAWIHSPVQGQIQRVLVSVGDRVRKGQVLAYIVGQEIGEIAAQFLQAKAQWTFCRSALDRQRALQENQATARKELLAAQAEFEKAQADLHAQHSRMHAVGIDEALLAANLDTSKAGQTHSSFRLPIISPLAGVVVERNAVIGQNAEAATPLMKILDPSQLWAEASVYENDWHKITVPCSIQFFGSARPDEAFAGTLVYLAPRLDEETRAAKVRAILLNPDNRLVANMYGRLIIPLPAAKPAMVVNSEAIVEIDKQPSVFIAQSDTTFILRPVHLGASADTLVEISQGVMLDERVVSHGAFLLKSELLKSEFSEEEE